MRLDTSARILLSHHVIKRHSAIKNTSYSTNYSHTMKVTSKPVMSGSEAPFSFCKLQGAFTKSYRISLL